MNDHCNAPDPEGLAIAREIQKKVRPSETILLNQSQGEICRSIG